MAKFDYTGRVADGRPISGSITALTAKDAAVRLREEGVEPTRVTPIRRNKTVVDESGRGIDPARFCRGLAQLIEAEMPLPEALRALSEDCGDRKLRESLLRAADAVSHGKTLSQALETESRILPPVLVAMLEAGSGGASLAEVLRLASEHASRMNEIRRNVISAAVYPVVVLLVSAFLLVLAALWIVPLYEKLFDDVGVHLPLPTRFVLTISDLVRDHPAQILAGGGLLVIALWILFSKCDHLAPCVSLKRWIAFHLPVYGRILKNAWLTRFCSFMQILLDAGVPVHVAVERIAAVDAKALSPKGAEMLADALREGVTLSEAMEFRRPMFPAFLIWAVRSSETTGRLPEAFGEAAELYRENLEAESWLMARVLPPLLIIPAALPVGFVILSLFLPILKMQSGLF